MYIIYIYIHTYNNINNITYYTIHILKKTLDLRAVRGCAVQGSGFKGLGLGLMAQGV